MYESGKDFLAVRWAKTANRLNRQPSCPFQQYRLSWAGGPLYPKIGLPGICASCSPKIKNALIRIRTKANFRGTTFIRRY